MTYIYPQKPNPIDNLAVVVFRTANPRYNDFVDWKERRNILPFESCSRQSWLGTVNDLKTMPELQGREKDGVHIYQGADAYRYLLTHVCGIDVRLEGDSRIIHQFKEAWTKFAETSPERASDLQPIVTMLLKDAQVIRSGVTQYMVAPRVEKAASMLGDLGEGKEALLVTKIGNDGNLTKSTIDMAGHIAKNRASHVKHLQFTAPNDADRKALEYGFSTLKREKRIHAKPEYVPWSRVTESMSNLRVLTPTTFVMVPLRGREAEELLHGYDNQISRGTMVMLRGAGARNSTDAFWKEAARDEFRSIILPEEIALQQEEMATRNKELEASGLNMITNCVVSREHGKLPVPTMLALDPERYLHQTGIGRSASFLSRV